MANKKKTSFTLSVEVLEALDKLAKQNKRSMANMIEVLVLEAERERVQPTPKPNA